MANVITWLDLSVFGISIFMALVAIAATLISYSVYSGNSSPDVIVYLELDRDAKSIFNLMIKNIGNGSAKNIKFKPESPLPEKAYGQGNSSMPKQMTSGPIITGIPYLAPNSFRSIMLGQYSGLNEWLRDKSIVINIECERANKKFGVSNVVKSSSSIDVYSFATSQTSDNSNAKSIRDEFIKLNKEMISIRKHIESNLNES